MGSDTAWMIGVSAPGLPEAHTSYGNALSTSSLGDGDFPSWAVVSPRTLSQPINDLRGLGIVIDENNAVLKGLRAAVLTGYSLYVLYNAVAALRRAEALKETAIAAGETAVLAATLQWHMIAQGVAAAALVTGAFAIGEKFGSGDWNLPSVNMNNPADRRNAARQLKQVTGR
jgi:hypothetical protein